MKTIEEEEKRDKLIAFSTAFGVGTVLLLICAFTIVWTPPDPPPPQYGLEVDFGFEELPIAEDISETPPQKNQMISNLIENEEEEDNENDDNEIEETVENDAETEELEAEEVEEAEVITNPPVKKEPKKAVVLPIKKIITNPVVTPKKVKSRVDVKSFLSDDDDDDEDEEGEETNNQNNNTENQNNHNTTTVTNTKERGKPILNLSGGWQWTSIPNEKDPSNEVGIVKIGFRVGSDGFVEYAKILPATTLSFPAASFYVKQMEKQQFHRVGNSSQQHSKSDYGTVTFFIQRK